MPYSRPKLSGLYTLSQIKLLENPSQPHSHFYLLLTKLEKRGRHLIAWRKKQYKD